MERVLTNLCSFVDSRVLSKLNNSILTPNTLTTIASSMSSHTFFRPIFCQLLVPFFSDYLHIIHDDFSKLVSPIVFHQLLLFLLFLSCIVLFKAYIV